jgi:hypothetical protein
MATKMQAPRQDKNTRTAVHFALLNTVKTYSAARTNASKIGLRFFVGPSFFPNLQLNYEHWHGLNLEKRANQVLSPANWIRIWFSDLIFDG